MKRYSTTALLILLLTFTIAACGWAAKRADIRSNSPSPGPYLVLRQGLEAFSAGSFQAAAASFDNLLAQASPNDSQLVFIALYYGIRSRINSGATEAADSLYELKAAAVPAAQRPELELVIGRLAVRPAGAAELEAVPAVARRIGVILPLSGQFFEFGQAILEGIKLALGEFNRGRVGEQAAEIVPLDDMSDPIRAAALGRELASDSTVAAVIGSYGEETSLSIALVAAASGIPLICPTADAPGLDGLGPLVHVLNRTDPAAAGSLAEFAVDRMGLHTFAVLAEDDERGRLLADSFTERVRDSGAVVIVRQNYPAQTSNFENQMNLIQRYLPDALYLTAKSAVITQIASQVYYYGLQEVQLLGGEHWDSERVIRLGGNYVNGGVFASPFFEQGESLRWHEFKSLYEQTYRRPVNRYSA
ncbi:MAG: ABC transporter substrate-binding protein, partial [Candidatus Glassbacteria bacterium]